MVDLDAPRVARGSLYLSLQAVLTNLVGVLGFSVMARFISRAEMGVYAALFLFSSAAQLVCRLGLLSPIVKFVSERVGRGEDYSSYVLSALALTSALSLALVLACAFLSESISAHLLGSRLYSRLITLVSAGSAVALVSSVLSSFLHGCGLLEYVSLVWASSSAVRWSAILILVLNGYGLRGVVYGWILGDLFAAALLAARSAPLLSLKGKSLTSLRSASIRLLRFSWPLYVSSIVSFVYRSYDKFLVLAYLPLSDVGVYSVACSIFNRLASLAAAMGGALFPYYGMLRGRGSHASIGSAVGRACKYAALLLSPLILGLAAVSRPVLELYAGPAYASAWTVLLTLSLFGITYAFSPAFSGLMLVYDRTRQALVINVASILLSLAALPLLRYTGLSGLAVVRGVSIVAAFAMSLAVISRDVEIKIDASELAKILASSGVMAAAVYAVQQVFYSPLLLPAYVVLGGAVYLYLIKALRVIGREDAAFLRRVVGRKYAKTLDRMLSFIAS